MSPSRKYLYITDKQMDVLMFCTSREDICMMFSGLMMALGIVALYLTYKIHVGAAFGVLACGIMAGESRRRARVYQQKYKEVLAEVKTQEREHPE